MAGVSTRLVIDLKLYNGAYGTVDNKPFEFIFLIYATIILKSL